MRLRQRDLKKVYVKKHIPAEDEDGTSYDSYAEEGQPVEATIQPAGGKTMAEMYGQRLAYMLTMRCMAPSVEIQEQDGVCVYVGTDQQPDYKVVAVHPWEIKVYDLEKV